MTRADILEAWNAHLAQGRRRSAHTVRAYGATAARLLDAIALDNWAALARLDAAALRAQLARRRAEGLSNAELATHVPVHVKLEGEGPVPDDTPSPTVLIDDIENLAEELHIPVPGHEATHTKE